MKPFFSIIIPNYNLGKYLPECLASVMQQEYQDFEVIIIDDGSTEELSHTYFKDLQQEKVQVHLRNNEGVSAARNFGASVAKGDYFLFLDADDKIDKRYLRLAYEKLQADHSIDYIYCDLQEFERGNNYRSLGELVLDDVLLHAVTHVSGIISRRLWNRVGGFDIDYRNGWEDWDLLIRITATAPKYYKIPEPMLLYRIRENSRDQHANAQYNAELEQKIFLKNINIYLTKYKEPLTLLRDFEKQKKEISDWEIREANAYKTKSYRLGSMMLSPFKFFSRKPGGKS